VSEPVQEPVQDGEPAQVVTGSGGIALPKPGVPDGQDMPGGAE